MKGGYKMKKISNSSKGIMTTSIRRGIKKSIPLYILLLPSAVLLFCFAYLPMYGLIIAFKDYSPGLGIMGSPWVGLKHFIKFFNSYQFGLTLKNTLSISVYGIIVGFPLPIALALMCNQIRNQKFKKVFQVTTYLPHFISTMVMCGLILIFLSPSSGIIANFFKLFDIQIPNFMASVTAFKHVYVWSDIWQHLGWDSIIYLAALSAIDPTYYEAATIDGASTMQKIRYIDLPLIISTAMILLILRAGGILSIGFEKALLLQNIQNGMGSEIISTYVYKVGMQSFQYSLSTAIGLFNTVVNFAVLLVVNWFSKKTTGAGLI
jgi:putative aldouronate transport system permease protein